ncbi:MAG: MFS transporter [Clostridia bacterium]|nr:MFS transporter [Clostridia bacterium]
MADEKNTKSFVEGVFSAEDTSAANISKQKLNKYSAIATKMFHTGVLSPKEMAYPAISDLASKLMVALDNYKMLYYVKVLKIDLTYIVIIDMLIGIYNTLNDPLMGALYDRTRTRWGKARPYILMGAAPFYTSTALLYCGGLFFGSHTTNDPKKIIFVFVMLFIQETFSTIYGLPRGYMLSMQTVNPSDRIAVGLLQQYIGGTGAGIIYMLFAPIIDFNEKGYINFPMPTLYAVVAIFACSVGIIGNMTMAINCKERIMLQPKPAPLSKSLFYILKNKYMLRNTIAAYSVAWINSGGYSWDVTTHLEIYGGTIVNFFVELPQNILNPLSLTFIPKFQKMFKNNRSAVITLRLWDLGTMLLMCALTIPFVDKRLFICIVSAVCLGVNAVNNGPASVFEAEVGREITDYTEYMTGERPDGTIGIFTQLLGELIRPLRTMFGLAMIKWSGYDTTLPQLPWAQGSKIIYQKVFFLYRGLGIISTLVCIIPYFFYDLVGEKREQMYIALNERRALLANENKTNEALEEIISSISSETK